MYKYTQTEPGLYTVSYTDPVTGQSTTDSDHENREDARTRVAFLNGFAGASDAKIRGLEGRLSRVEKHLNELLLNNEKEKTPVRIATEKPTNEDMVNLIWLRQWKLVPDVRRESLTRIYNYLNAKL